MFGVFGAKKIKIKNDPIRSAALGLIAPILFYINGYLLQRCSVLIISVSSFLKKNTHYFLLLLSDKKCRFLRSNSFVKATFFGGTGGGFSEGVADLLLVF